MSEHAQLAFLFGRLAVVALAVACFGLRRQRRARNREGWDALCQKWLSEGQITGYSIGPELIFIEFGPNDWHEFR